MMTGSSSLKSTNNVSFDKMLSREQVNASDEDRVHGGRFLYMPKSEFLTQGKKKFEFNFNKQQSRNPDKFLGTDLKKARAFTTPESDLQVMKAFSCLTSSGTQMVETKTTLIFKISLNGST